MSPLEHLFALEVEFHRRLRTAAPGTGDAAAIHTSYALHSGYEQLLQRVGRVTGADIEALRERLSLAGDARDVLSARDSVMAILGLDWGSPRSSAWNRRSVSHGRPRKPER